MIAVSSSCSKALADHVETLKLTPNLYLQDKKRLKLLLNLHFRHSIIYILIKNTTIISWQLSKSSSFLLSI